MSSPRRSRSRPLVAIGASLSLIGLSYYLYQRLLSSSGSASCRDDAANIGESRGESSRTAKKNKPSMSLSLPITFVRNAASMALLEQLLSSLSRHYLVTLIAPPPTSDFSSHTISTATGSGVQSVASLSQELSAASEFDSRRVLEYSKEEGRVALARALACDAHCEIMLSPRSSKVNGYKDTHAKEEDPDGDRTPRALSPRRGDIVSPDEERVALLEHYHAEMARIRKSSSLLVFLLLPTSTSTSISVGDARGATISFLPAETVIQPFLLPGQHELSSRVPGVKIVDARTASTSQSRYGIGEAWKEGADRVIALSKGWQ